MSSEVERRLRSLEDDVTGRNGAVCVLERRVDDLERALAEERTRVTSLSESFDRLAAAFERVVGVLERDRGVHSAESEAAL